MRLQSLSEPRSLFPSRGFHRPVPTPLRHAPFMSSPPGRSECAAGNNPHKTAANNLAKLATSPLPLPVGAEAAEDDGEPFEEKMERLTTQLQEQFAESDKLEKTIKKNLKVLGF